MIKILFVCHGNICRSPMAEFIMKRLVGERGLTDMFEIKSAATSNEEIGNPVYPPARQMLEKHGIFCKRKRAVRMTRADYERYDYVVAMDWENIRGIKKIIGARDYLEKLSLLLDHTPYPGEVADPWYTRDFDEAWRTIDAGCKALLEEILEKYRLC